MLFERVRRAVNERRLASRQHTRRKIRQLHHIPYTTSATVNLAHKSPRQFAQILFHLCGYDRLSSAPMELPGAKERVVPNDGRFWSRVMVVAAALVVVLGLAGGATAQASDGGVESQAAGAIGAKSPAATLAARRALVRHETSLSAERADGRDISLRQASVRGKATQAQLNARTVGERVVEAAQEAGTQGIAALRPGKRFRNGQPVLAWP